MYHNRDIDIDIVVSWVDDSDPEWRRERAKYSGKPEDCDAVRFRDWGLLRYWFRAVEAYMPWVRKIHFVTAGHYPSWLDRSNPKLHLVKHSDFIPDKYLPTFSARPIELNFHRIPGLSEHFVYFNDDMFPAMPLNPRDVFYKGLPCGSAIISPLIAIQCPWPFGHTLVNDISFVNKHFSVKQTFRGNLRKWFSLCYGRYILKNILNSFNRNYFLGFEVFHEPASLTKETFERLWEMEPELMDQTCSHRFRHNQDVNQYVLQYYQFCSNRFHPRSPKCVKYYDVSDDNSLLTQSVLHAKTKFVVVNDSAHVSDFEKAKTELLEAFTIVHGTPSSFENDR